MRRQATESITVVSVTGELDISRKEECRKAFHLHGDETALLLDLSEVTYADSSILAELFRFYNESKAAKVPVAVLITSPQFLRIINYAGLSSVIEVFNTRGQALQFLGETRT